MKSQILKSLFHAFPTPEMGLGRAFLHGASKLLCQLVCLFLVHIVFSCFSNFKYVFSIAVEQALRGLVLHDAASRLVEIDAVGVAEPVVDDHRQVKLVVNAFFDIKVNGQLHDEVVLVELGAVLVLSDAEMDGQGSESSLAIGKLPVQFHVVVAAAQHVGPEHVRLGRVAEEARLVVGLVKTEGETQRGVVPRADLLSVKHLALRDVGVNIEDMLGQLGDGVLGVSLFHGMPLTVLVKQLYVRQEPLYLGDEERVTCLVDIAQSVGGQRLAVDFVADIKVDIGAFALLGAGHGQQSHHDVKESLHLQSFFGCKYTKILPKMRIFAA